jgi:hypothetical protein
MLFHASFIFSPHFFLFSPEEPQMQKVAKTDFRHHALSPNGP